MTLTKASPAETPAASLLVPTKPMRFDFGESESKVMTGIFASTFAIGMGVHRAARRMGVRIPEDISLVALHDSELADYLSPTLTTVGLPVEEMAHRAVDHLVDLIDGGSPRSIVVRTAPILTLRESTARPRKANESGFASSQLRISTPAGRR